MCYYTDIACIVYSLSVYKLTFSGQKVNTRPRPKGKIMGSGSSRNQKDSVERRLKTAKTKSPSGAGGAPGGGDSNHKPTISCPLTFPVKLLGKPVLPVGTKPLELKKEQGTLWVYYKSLRLMSLEAKLNTLILMCMDEKGFRYTGAVHAGEGGQVYAKFVRST